MASQLELVFGTGGGKEEICKVFTQQPLGMDFRCQMPIVITRLRGEGQAEELGIKIGWRVHSINGTSLAGMTIEEAYALLVASAAPLHRSMLVRRCPLETTSTAALSRKVKRIHPTQVVEFLQRFGFVAQSAHLWGEQAQRPELFLGAINGHREVGKPRHHTWYAIIGKVTNIGEGSSTQRWRVERRLAHVRALLHDPVKQEMGHEYAHHFQRARFAHHGGLPGTTAKIETWLAALSKAIRAGKLSPALVASILCFLEAPCLHEGEEQANQQGAKDVVGNIQKVGDVLAAVSEVHASSACEEARYAEATTSGLEADVASIGNEEAHGDNRAADPIAVDEATISQLLAAETTEATEAPEQPHTWSFHDDSGAEVDLEGAAEDDGSAEDSPVEAVIDDGNIFSV